MEACQCLNVRDLSGSLLARIKDKSEELRSLIKHIKEKHGGLDQEKRLSDSYEDVKHSLSPHEPHVHNIHFILY